MRRKLVAATVLGVASVVAHADTITDRIDLSTFLNGPPLYATFTVTLDPTQNYLNETTGLTVENFYFPTATRAQFNPPTFGFNYTAATGTLVLGGIDAGVSVLSPTSDDTILSLQLLGQPVLNSLVIDFRGDESMVSGPTTLTVTQLSAVSPEPSTFALLGTGALAVAGVRRRRTA